MVSIGVLFTELSHSASIRTAIESLGKNPFHKSVLPSFRVESLREEFNARNVN